MLGPILFILYTADLVAVVTKLGLSQREVDGSTSFIACSGSASGSVDYRKTEIDGVSIKRFTAVSKAVKQTGQRVAATSVNTVGAKYTMKKNDKRTGRTRINIPPGHPRLYVTCHHVAMM